VGPKKNTRSTADVMIPGTQITQEGIDPNRTIFAMSPLGTIPRIIV